MEGITLDQLQTFLTVVQTGGFSSAARLMRRSQSSVTYTISKLEDQTGLTLFNRDSYRPSLTAAGHSLMPRAKRVINDFNAFTAHALSITGGLESELTLVLDPVFPMASFLEVMGGFRDRFPQIRTRLYTESMGAGAKRLIEKTCDLSIGVAFAFNGAQFDRSPLGVTQLVMVASCNHPLAKNVTRISRDDMNEHVQLVLTDVSDMTKGRDFSVFSDQTWRLGDLSTKHAMLIGGVGFGALPAHWVENDLAEGRLVRLHPESPEWDTGGPILPLCVSWLKDSHRGPACLWLLERLQEVCAPYRTSGQA